MEKMIRAANGSPQELAETHLIPPISAVTSEATNDGLCLITEAAVIRGLAQPHCPPPGYITLSAACAAQPPAVHRSPARIHILLPTSGPDITKLALDLATKEICAAACDRPPVILVETSFLKILGSERSVGDIASALESTAHHARKKPVHFFLAPTKPLGELPPAKHIPVTSYSMRACPEGSPCHKCDIHDNVFKRCNITLDTELRDLLAFGSELRKAGFEKHSPPANVFRAPEESEGVPIDTINPQLRTEVQQWFDNHAASPPTQRPAARSPLYKYSEDGGVLPRWSTPPSKKIRSRTTPGSQQRYVLYKEMLKDVVCDDIETIPIADIAASCAVFVVWHPQTGKPRPCAAPFEANELSPPAPVRYGNPRDLYSVPGASAGVRLDFERGFKHCRLSRYFGVHVAFILDGVGILPKSVFFGLRDGPLIFCSTLEQDMRSAPIPPPPLHMQRAVISPRVSWVDDVAQLGDPPEYVVMVFFALVKHMAARGWRFGVDKCFFLPCWLLKFIGTLLDVPSSAFRIPLSTCHKLADWARDILRAASLDEGQPITPVQRQLLESHMGRIAWVTSIGVSSLSFARNLVDRSLAADTWRAGARDLLIYHARASSAWNDLTVNVTLPERPAILVTDGSVAPDIIEVTGSGHVTLPGSPDEPTHFTVTFSQDQLKAFGFSTAQKPSSTWAEAAVATVGADFAQEVIRAEGDTVDAIVHMIDSRTVAQRAAFCSAADFQCSAFYLLIQHTSAPLQHTLHWLSRRETQIAKADAGSNASSGLWRPVPQLFQALVGFDPALDLTADCASTAALRYSSPHQPADATRLANLISLSSELAKARSGFIGAPGFADWSGLRVTGTLIPAYTSILPILSRAALSSDNWALLIVVQLSPDIQAVLSSWLTAGVSFMGAATPCNRIHSVLVAPDGSRPRSQFPTRLIFATKGPMPPPAKRPDVQGWCTVSGPLIFDRSLSAEEALIQWIRSGQCPHPGPPKGAAASLIPSAAFLSAALPATQEQPAASTRSDRLPAVRSPFLTAAQFTPSAAAQRSEAHPVATAHAAALAHLTIPSSTVTLPPPTHVPAPFSAFLLAAARLAATPTVQTPPQPTQAPGPAAPVVGQLPPSRMASGSHRHVQSSSTVTPPASGAADRQPPGVTLPPCGEQSSNAATAVQTHPPAQPNGEALCAPSSVAAAMAASRSVQPLQSSLAPAALPTVATAPASLPARSVRDRMHGRRSAGSTRGVWVDTALRCGQCHRLVAGSDDSAMLCDHPDCSDWLVCSTCIPHDPDVPLLCPLHQLERYRQSQMVAMGMVTALRHKPGSVGRLMGCLTAWVGSPRAKQQPIDMQIILLQAPVTVTDLESSLPPLLAREVSTAERSLWNDARRSKCRNVIFKMAWLAVKLEAMDASIHPALTALAKAYIRHRLSSDRPPGWRKAGADHISSEVSALKSIMDDLQWPFPPYLGTKRVLEARGAFQKREHSPRWPIPPYRIFEMAAKEPRPMTAKRQLAVDALQWHAFWGVRPGYLWRIGKANYACFKGGFVFRWDLETKVKRGDKEAAGEAKLKIPQTTAAKHPILTDVWSRMPDSGPVFEAAKDAVPALVKEWFGDEVSLLEDFTLAHVGVRNGLDMALQVLGLPPDYIDAHLWWTRSTPRMRAYYAGLVVGIMFWATERLHLVRFTPLAPGWYEVLSKPSTPCWEEIPRLEDAPAALPAQVLAVDDVGVEGVDEELGPPPCQAPKGAHGVMHAKRRRGVRVSKS